jgi:hypothetical protein
MVVWVIVNVEEWDPTQTMPRTVLTPPAGGAPMPDIPNWAWHEYGNRVGFWRILKVFDEFAIPGVLAINGSRLQPTSRSSKPRSPGVGSSRVWVPSATCESRGQARRHPQDPRRDRAGAGKRRAAGSGRDDRSLRRRTFSGRGYDYVADWVLDDQPVRRKTRTQPIVSIPYTQGATTSP